MISDQTANHGRPPPARRPDPIIAARQTHTPEPRHPRLVTDHRSLITGMDWTTWWLWRGARTRSLPELGRENPQRPWYCVSRHGRVGRRQVFQSSRPSSLRRHHGTATRYARPERAPTVGRLTAGRRQRRPASNQTHPRTRPEGRYGIQRGVEQPGSSSGS